MKTQSTHTPGPWACNLGNGTNLTADCTIWGDSERVVVAEVGDSARSYSTPRDIANARLISAAPDLLAAAQEFVRRVEAGEIRSKTAYGLFKAAIEKATV